MKKITVKTYQQDNPYGCGAAVALMILETVGIIHKATPELEEIIYNGLRGSIVGTPMSALFDFLKTAGADVMFYQQAGWWTKANMKLARWILNKSNSIHNSTFIEMLNDAIADVAVAGGIQVMDRQLMSITSNTLRKFIDDGHIIAIVVTIVDGKKQLVCHHWVIVNGYNDDQFIITDPASGSEYSINAKTLNDAMNGFYGRIAITVKVQ